MIQFEHPPIDPPCLQSGVGGTGSLAGRPSLAFVHPALPLCAAAAAAALSLSLSVSLLLLTPQHVIARRDGDVTRSGTDGGIRHHSSGIGLQCRGGQESSFGPFDTVARPQGGRGGRGRRVNVPSSSSVLFVSELRINGVSAVAWQLGGRRSSYYFDLVFSSDGFQRSGEKDRQTDLNLHV